MGKYTAPASSGGGGTFSGTIASPQVAIGTAADTIGGDANLTWDSTNQVLKSTYGIIANVYEVVADVDITKGQAVYTTGFNGGSGKPQVDLAQADNAATMPAIGIASANILTGQTGLVIIDGELDGITTTGSQNDILYVSATVAGALTNVRPTAPTELVQNMGNIIKVGVGGKIAVTTTGRTNDVPNTFSIEGDISTTGAFNAPQLPTVSVTTGTVNMTKATHAGRYVLFSGGTLALPASFAVGEHYTVINTTSAGRSVSAASGDTINGGAGGGSVTVPAYGSVTFVGVVADTTWVGLGV